MAPDNLSEFARRVHDQLCGNILPFWTGPALDHEQGGWLAWMSNDLRVDRSQPKGLILNSRILWAFSAVYRAQPQPLYQEMAKRAFEVVMKGFWDLQYGGAFWRIDGEGRVGREAALQVGVELGRHLARRSGVPGVGRRLKGYDLARGVHRR